MDSKTFIQSLPPVYWSQRHPSTYTVRFSNRDVGIGLLAASCYGTWNLLHDKFDWTVFKGHEMGAMAWPLVAKALRTEVQGVPLSDTVVALGPKQWPIWWKANREGVALVSRIPVDHALGWPVVKSNVRGSV
jgi:hypothetical protein